MHEYVGIDVSTVGDSARSVSAEVIVPEGARSVDVWMVCQNVGTSAGAVVTIEAAPPTPPPGSEFIGYWTNPVEMEKQPSNANTIVKKGLRCTPGMRLRGRTTTAASGGTMSGETWLVFVFSGAEAVEN